MKPQMRRRGIGTATQVLGLLALLIWFARGANAAELACPDCHGPDGIPAPHDSECRNPSCLQSCHPGVDFDHIAHLTGPGTPISADRTATCNNCHNRPFDGVYHPYRINALAGSLTAPGYVDLNEACGRCHGGGTQQASTTGSITSGSTVLTVANGAGFGEGNNIRVTGAGATGNLETSIASVVGTTINLNDPAGTTVSNAAVVQGPTNNGAMYRTKSILATVAKGMHSLATVTYPVTFTTTVGSGANSLHVDVAASVGCDTGCPTFAYEWSWGDGTANDTTSGANATHTYAATGTCTLGASYASKAACISAGGSWSDSHTWPITVTVTADGKITGMARRTVTVYTPDLPPVASGDCTWNANTWTVSVKDTSTDTGPTGVMNAIVTWGDGGTSTGVPGATLTHTYVSVGGPYTLTLKATDTALQSNTTTLSCSPPSVQPATFTITGKVKNRLGTAGLASASIIVKKGTLVIATKFTAADGSFSITGLKPATYTFIVTKSGYTFAYPAATLSVGPSIANITISATAP